MIAVTGAAGQLGTAMCEALGGEAIPLVRSDLDLEEPAAIEPVVRSLGARALINCAAYTDVDGAESDADRARTVNAEAVGELARVTAAVGMGFVTFSTDYVFDGTQDQPYVESDQPNPQSVYGTTKREGELLALEHHDATLVVRTSWVLSGTHGNFAATMLRLIAAGPVQVVDDQRGHPTLAGDLAPAALVALEQAVSGVLHLTNQGALSWYELALECAEIAGLDASGVTPCRTEDFPRPASRPRNSVLGSERLEALGLTPLPHYRPSLVEAIARLQASARS